MSKSGVSTAPVKPDGNLFKKEPRTPNSGSNSKDDRRSSSGFSSGNRGNQNQNSSNLVQTNQQHERSSSRNENRQFENKSGTEPEKATEKDDKAAVDNASGPGATTEKKFTGRCRLFVGNLTPDVTENEFKKMFEPFGEISEVYVNTSRGFGFIRLDYRHNAEAAKAALDGHQRKGRILRVRFATHGAALKVKNLHPYVSNELLEQSFSQFGELERCVVIVDDRGKPTGEGIVEFVRKPGANSALRRINEGVFLMGVDPKPVAVEPLEQKDEEDGMPEKFLTKTDQYKKERDKEPRFAPPGTFEYEFGMRWKALEDLEKQRIDQIKKDTEEARIKLEDEMQNALYEYQAEQIRQDLLRQQEELRRLEELRNQDRMRRQQELEMRRQQEERDRAQQDDRRRTDMMLSMRQQELARGRGPIDAPGLRSRDDMLMAERYGERMSDRMPDRMGDRMSDRMNDRMGPSQSGFLWEDKQRGEAGMRGEGGRGRDMRGSGAPPLQPPPVPPSAMSSMERGGPSVASAAAQSSKSSPKPLMGSSGFGNQSSGGQGQNSAASGADSGNQMKMDFLVEPAQDECHNTDDIQHHEVPGSFNSKSTFQLALSKSNHIEIDSALPSYSDKITANEDQPMAVVTNSDDEQPGLWETKVDYRSNSPIASSRRGSKICSESSSSSNDHKFIEMEMCQNKDTTETQNNSPAKRAPCGNNSGDQSVFNSNKVSLKSNDSVTKLNSESCSGDAVLISEISSIGSKFPLIKDCVQNDVTYAVNISNKSLAPYQKENANDQYMSIENEKENSVNLSSESSTLNKDIEHDPSKIRVSLQRYLSADNVSDKLVSDGKLQRYLSADNVNCDMETQLEGKLTAERYLGSENCQPVVHSEDSYQSTEAISIHTSDLPPQYSLKNSHTSATVVQSSSKSPDFNQSASVQEMCNSSSDNYESSPVTKLIFPFSATKTVNKSDESDYSMSDAGESDYKQLMEEYKSTTEYQATVSCNSYQSTLVENESCYKQADQNDASNYSQKNNDINLTSYKQSGVDDVGDMDTETLDEEDGTHATDGPGIYQSYEEGIISPHYQNAALNALGGLSVVAEYNTVTNSDNKWSSASSSNIEQDVASTSNSECSKGESYNSSTYPATQNTHTELSMSSSKNTSSPTLATSSQAQPLGPTSEDDHEGALCTGDQSFKTAAARQSALVPFMQTSRSMPFVPNINPSMYAGTAMVQGMNGPTIMSSSSVHIAQHPGGATIMRHQTVSAGLNGGITQATLMQQQAMSNGAQATAVLQQRTLTNRGQTMVLQQRTMTTGLGGMTQQTLVQQRMAAPNSVAQAMYHANAMRQRAIVNQQATMLQHRAIRLAQARVMSSQLLRAQALSGAAFLQQAGPGNPTSIIGPNLVRGGTPGSVMQQLVRQRYLGGPVMPGRGVQMVAGRPVRVKVTYTRGSLPMESNT